MLFRAGRRRPVMSPDKSPAGKEQNRRAVTARNGQEGRRVPDLRARFLTRELRLKSSQNCVLFQHQEHLFDMLSGSCRLLLATAALKYGSYPRRIGESREVPLFPPLQPGLQSTAQTLNVSFLHHKRRQANSQFCRLMDGQTGGGTRP